VVAPVSGLTGRSAQSEGSLLSANETLLTTISQLDPIWIRFHVSESDQLKLARGAAENRLVLPKSNAFDVSVKLADNSIVPRKGSINFADPASTRRLAITMRAELDNPGGSPGPGSLSASGSQARIARTRSLSHRPRSSMAHRASSLRRDKDGKDVALPRPVVVGDWTDGKSNQWIIESGLKPGEAVIVEGVARVMFPGQPIQVVAPGAAKGPAGAPADPAKK
jgi:membrane fusion protein (multidrug efflux system)